jgi:thiol:disulfide interchange protein DsbD
MPIHLRQLSLLILVVLALAMPTAGANSLSNLFGGSSTGKFPPAEQAFPFSAELISPQVIAARWDTRDGFYLYRDKIALTFPNGEAGIVELVLPDGTLQDDPYFGRLHVLHGPVEARLRLDRPLPEGTLLQAQYQGCADAGLCYPPQTTELQLTSGSGSGSAASTSSAAGAVPAPAAGSGGTLQTMLTEGRPLLVFGSFFVAGILLAFTACLYPMIPILSGLIAGDRHRGGSLRSFLLSLVYIEATAITYAAAGVAAGLSGVAIQANLQSPWTLGAFAGLFVLLSLSMFGVFSLQLPASVQTRLSELSGAQKGGTFIGAAIMGILSALIVGACSGPALIAALAFISSTGDYVLGGLALFTLANGMGLPLLLIGTAAGRWLPRSGPWMNKIQQIFGVGFLIVALWLVERLLPGHLALALWGALLLGCAVYLGAFDSISSTAGGLIRLRKFAGVLLLIWSSLLLLGSAGGGSDFWRPLAAFADRSGSATMQASSLRVHSTTELDTALAQARAAGQPVMLDVRADWCVYCIQLERSTFPAPEVQQALAGALLLTIDVTAMNADDKALLQRLDVFLPPAVIFYDAQGRERAEQRIVGFLGPAAFAAQARQALAGSPQPL